MHNLFVTIDRLLKGGYTRRDELREGRVGISAGLLAVCTVVLGIAYGLFMGLWGVLRPGEASVLQLLATTIKVPLLFLLTLAVTFPSLYVFSVLSGSRLSFRDSLRLILVGIVVTVTLLASFGPVTGFFTLSTESYPFMIVLNVLFFAVSGVAGLIVTYKALGAVLAVRSEWERIEEAPSEPESGSASGPEPEEAPTMGEPGASSEPAAPGATPPSARLRRATPDDIYPPQARFIFFVWTLIYGAVGAQMGWILRPFIGHPSLPFRFFRERTSNFFEAFFRTLGELFG